MNLPEIVQVVCPHCDTTNRVPRARLADGGKCGACKRPLFEGHPVALDDARRFAAHAVHNDIPLLVDFWAAWCGPCRAVAPAFAQAAAQLEPDLRVAKVDTDAVPELAERFAIRSIPTMALVRHDREIARVSGAMSAAQILAWVREQLARADAAPQRRAGADSGVGAGLVPARAAAGRGSRRRTDLLPPFDTLP